MPFLFLLKKGSLRSWNIQIFYRLFGYVEKRLDKKAQVDFKIYNVTD